MAGVRQARIQDAPEISRIEVETWRETYPGMVADDVLIGMSAQRKSALWAWELGRAPENILVWDDGLGGLLGFGHCGRQRDPSLPYDGEVTMLYVHPDAQGNGIGRGLIAALFARLSEIGCRSALIWVVRVNPSRFFYERLGGRLVLQRTVPVGRGSVETLGYAWDDLQAMIRPTAARYRPGRTGYPPFS